MPKFIYAFGVHARDFLMDLQYSLLKSDESRQIYVFANKDSKEFVFDGTQYVLSNVLTF